MATGKTSKDIFKRTIPRPSKPDIALEVPPRIMGRPKAAEAYQKVTVCLFNRQTIGLDKVALAIREKTGQHVHRAELIRALVNHAAAWINLNKPEDFSKAVKSLLPGLERTP